MIRNDAGDERRKPIPWTPRRKRIVQCLGRADGTAEVGWLLDCCLDRTATGDPSAPGAPSAQARRQFLEVDLPVLEGYGVVRWEGSDRVALADAYVEPTAERDDQPPELPVAVAAVLATAVALHAAAVPPFAAVSPLWYAVAAIAALVVLPVGYRQLGRRSGSSPNQRGKS